jgi:hypothetical protein
MKASRQVKNLGFLTVKHSTSHFGFYDIIAFGRHAVENGILATTVP